MPIPPPANDWLVSVPLNQLVSLQNSVAENQALREEIKRLNIRIDGLHRTQYELMEVVGELRRLSTVPARRSA